MICRYSLLLLYVKLVYAIHVTHVSECGKTRSCWLLPNGCKNSTDCAVMINWKNNGRALLLEIEADLKADGSGSWLALGISKDDIMATETLLKDSFTELRDNKALCGAEWILDFTVLEPREKKMMHKISSGKYHLMFAFGDLDADSRKKAHELAGEGAPWRSNDRTRFCNGCPTEFLDE